MKEFREKASMGREALERNLDTVFRNYIRKKYKYTCPFTGSMRQLSISHLFGQAEYPNLRWEEKNAVLMANRVHELYHTQNPFIYIDWFIETYGQEELTKLKERAYTRKETLSLEELIDMTNTLVKKTQALPKAGYKKELNG